MLIQSLIVYVNHALIGFHISHNNKTNGFDNV